jgi:hypothetical protein
VSVTPISAAVQKSTVVISGKLPSGKIISQDLPIPHAPGVADFQLIDAAIKSVRSVGGLMGDGEESGTVNFYPLLMFTGGINFKVNRVALVSSSSAIQ